MSPLNAKMFTRALNPFTDPALKATVYGIGDYLQWAKYIDSSKINLILEVGSRDAIDAIQLGYFYECPVYAFECNPEAIELCKQHVRNYPYVTVMPYACWNKSGVVPFYPVIKSHGGTMPVNLGASSLLIARKNGCDKEHEQGQPIEVQALRLDEWLVDQHIEKVDLLCMDCQGATLQVLQGLGDSLEQIKYVITEVYLTPSFEGEALYPVIRDFLSARGFKVVVAPPTNSLFCDVLFVNKRALLE